MSGHRGGGHPTGSAVLADLAALRQGYSYQYLKLQAEPPAFATDLELEIYLRTDDERLIDVLDFSEISEEADEDGYVLGYVALSNLLRQRELIRRLGAFVARTGQVRPLSNSVLAAPDFLEIAR